MPSSSRPRSSTRRIPPDYRGPLDKNIFKIPTDPDAVSFARIKADPAKYTGREFTLIGGLRTSDYYNYGYKDAADTHYSFEFQEMKSDGTVMGPSVPIYGLRLMATSLAERATVVEEQNSASLAIRLRCTIEPERLQGDASSALETIEAKDWSFFSTRLGKWLPWSYQGVTLGWALLFKTGKEARNACLDLIMADSDFQGEKADTILRGTAIAVLLKLPKIDRQAVYKSLPARAEEGEVSAGASVGEPGVQEPLDREADALGTTAEAG